MHGRNATALFPLLLLVALPLLPARLPAQLGKLWIVSDTGCPLVDFDEIQPAIDAAVSGDVILVRARQGGAAYGPFLVDAKSLVIVGDGSRPRFNGVSSIRNLGPGQSALVQGLVAASLPGRLNLSNNLGPILVEDCSLFGDANGPGVMATATSSVVFSRCDIGGPVFQLQTREGLVVVGSRAYLYDCNVDGGIGPYHGGGAIQGADGIRVGNGGVVFLSGGGVAGGYGGFGAHWTACTAGGSGGPGGDALFLEGPGAQVYRLNSTLTGGPGGLGGCLNPNVGGFCPAPCPDGPPGNPTRGNGGVITQVTGDARSYASMSPVLDQQLVTFDFTGQPGDAAILYASAAQNHIFFPQWKGVLVPKLAGFVPFVATVGPTGMLSTTLPMAGAPIPMGLAGVLHTQGLYVAPGLAVFLGPTQALVVLDEMHDPKDGCDSITLTSNPKDGSEHEEP